MDEVMRTKRLEVKGDSYLKKDKTKSFANASSFVTNQSDVFDISTFCQVPSEILFSDIYALADISMHRIGNGNVELSFRHRSEL